MMVSTRGVTFSAPCLFILSILISVGHSCPRGYYGSPCKGKICIRFHLSLIIYTVFLSCKMLLNSVEMLKISHYGT